MAMAFVSDKTICIACYKKVIDKGVECDDQCKRWFHPACVGVTPSEYKKIAEGSVKVWKCERVDCIVPRVDPFTALSDQMSCMLNSLSELATKGEIAELKNEILTKIDTLANDVSAIKSEVSSIRADLSALEPRVASVEDRILAIEEKVETNNTAATQCSLEELISESNDRARRSRNIMVYNVFESSSPDIKLKIKHDVDQMHKLFSPMLPTLAQSGIKAVRVGKKLPDKPRPLKVILPSPADVPTVFSAFDVKAAARLDPSFSAVKLSRDRTPRESQHLKDLNREIEHRKARGEEDLTIKFVNNIPKIIKSSKNE